MDLHKIHHPANFEFLSSFILDVANSSSREEVFDGTGAKRKAKLRVLDLGEDVFRVELRGPGVGTYDSRSELHHSFEGDSKYCLELDEQGGLRFAAKENSSASLHGAVAGTFGLSGKAWMVRLVPEATDRYFGMGEKWGPFEKSGLRSQFWTTDVWGDFDPSVIAAADVDSPYVAIPYLILRRNGEYFGVLLDCPYPAFIATNPVFSITGEDVSTGAGDATSTARGSGELYLGAQDGQPVVYFIAGPTLSELTRKLQRLVGVTPRPPLWALGHQQCRWGYAGLHDLERLDENFRKHEIPCDGLWLDIDYMDGFRVFTLNEEEFRVSRAQVFAKKVEEVPELARLRRLGRHIVPILDPGVKRDPDFELYQRGLSGGHFCENPTGSPYVGIVWPGETHFPDFSQEKTVKFWAKEVARFTAFGFAAFWIDMNDPSTGPVDNGSMLFGRGKKPHTAFHNQYGHLMSKATQEGLLLARPEERPFVLTRSAFTGTGQFAAVWTGDNVSSFVHLEKSVATTMNLALSGIPFNGPDVPGFGGDASPELAERWYEAACLFPFFRNHSIKGSKPQEPWEFPEKTTKILARYVKLRYRLLPYLYQQFVRQERLGEAIVSPLFYHYEPTKNELDLATEFMVGRDLLVAPVLSPSAERTIVLPSGSWFCLRTGEWFVGPTEIKVTVERDELPLFVRDGAVIPCSPSELIGRIAAGPVSAKERLSALELHVFSQSEGKFASSYEVDDGLTRAYQRGKFSEFSLEVESRGGSLRSRVIGPEEAEFQVRFDRAFWYGRGTKPTATASVVWTGKPIGCERVEVEEVS